MANRMDRGVGFAGFVRRAAETTALAGAALLLSSSAVQAKGTFLSQIPNAPASCSTCHITTQPVPSWNDFGLDVQANLASEKPDWAAVCNLDSDGDGASNGEELGDPDCLWTTGAMKPLGATSLPGDPSSKPAPPQPDEPPDSAEPMPEVGPEPMPEAVPDTGTDTGTSPDSGADTGPADTVGADTGGTLPPLDDGCAGAGSQPALPMAGAVLALFGWAILNRRRREPSDLANTGSVLRG